MSTDEVAPDSSYDSGAGFCIAIHAEQNVIMDTTPTDRKYGTIYITDSPCPGCLKMLHGSGVSRIVWPEGQWILDGKHWVRQDFERAIRPILLPLV